MPGIWLLWGVHYSKKSARQELTVKNKFRTFNNRFSTKIFTKHSTVCILFMVGGGSLKLAHDFMLSKERVILTYLTIISFWSMNRGWWKKQERAVELKTPGGSVQTVGNLCLHLIWQFCLLYWLSLEKYQKFWRLSWKESYLN